MTVGTEFVTIEGEGLIEKWLGEHVLPLPTPPHTQESSSLRHQEESEAAGLGPATRKHSKTHVLLLAISVIFI